MVAVDGGGFDNDDASAESVRIFPENGINRQEKQAAQRH